MRRRFPAALALLFLATAALAQTAAAPAAPPNIDRLVRVGKLWGTVRYLHPYLAYKDIDWDAALVAAIPRVREAKTVEEYKAAVQGMLDALGDPATRVADPPPPPEPETASPPKVPLWRQLDGGVLLVDLVKHMGSGNPREALGQVAALSEEIGKAPAVVVDLRGQPAAGWFFAQYLLDDLAPALASRRSRRGLGQGGGRQEQQGQSGREPSAHEASLCPG
jgi:hypothetical protein